MMKPLTIFDIAGRGMAAQKTRLNTVASNIANAGSIAGNKDNAYRALRPVFETIYPTFQKDAGVSTVDTVDVERSSRDPERRHMPGHPLADADGFVYATNVDINEEMVDMMEASRQYQNNIEVIATAKSLILKTLSVGK
jgi:flagellar basal-body rod protein FlgC